MSVSYRERDREREWDTESYRGGNDRGGRTYTTVKRYKVPDRDSYEDDRYEDDLKVTTSYGGGGRDRSRSNVRSNAREVIYERDDRSSAGQRSSRPQPRDHSPQDNYRSTDIRIERDISREPPRRERDDDYELERYTKSTEYYREPERAPQPIYINNTAPQPIIIREPAAAPQQVVIRERERERESERYEEDSRDDYAQSRQLARREPSPDPEEDYYYERRIRRVRREDDDYGDRREVAPRDSASQHGQDEYSEDESYYKRTTEETGRDSSPHHRRHLAEGAVAGLGAAALLRHHRKKEGEEPGSIGRLAGGAALGAVAAEGITRARSHFGRDRSRARSGERDREYTRGGRPRSRERSTSPNFFERVGDRWQDQSNLAKFGEVAALGALAAYAARKGRSKAEERRSRSRRRGGSRDRGRSSSSGGEGENHTRNTMIKAGLGSAAAAAVVEKVRSKSRGGRSHSKKRQALQAAGVGLGGAALAGLYERNKDHKKDKERGRSASRTRSRSRSVPPSEGQRNAPGNDQDLIEYGGDPIAPDGSRRSAGRDRGLSQSPPHPARLRSRSRDAGLEGVAGGAAAGGVAGAAAHAAAERRQRRREEREMRRQEDDRQEATQQGYGFGPYAQAPPEPMQQQQQQQPPFQQPREYYPYTNNFAPPPNNPYSPVPNIVNAGPPPPQDPAGYPNNAPYAPPQGPQPPMPEYGYPAAPAQEAYPNANANYRGPPHGSNVSYTPARYLPAIARLTNETKAVTLEQGSDADDSEGDGWHDKRKSVQFDLHPQQVEVPHYSITDRDGVGDVSDDGTLSEDEPTVPPTFHRRHEQEAPSEEERREDMLLAGPPADAQTRDRGLESPEDSADEERYHDYAGERDKQANETNGIDGEGQRNSREEGKGKGKERKRKRRRRHSVDGTPSRSRRERSHGHDDDNNNEDDLGNESDETVDLPDRFDQDGRKKAAKRGEDGVKNRIDDILKGRGTAGKLFQRFTGGRFGSDEVSGGAGSGQRPKQ